MMAPDFSRVSVYVRPGRTDMRKAANGLSILAEEHMDQDPLSGAVFLFCNRERRIVKALYWDGTGFCLWLVAILADCCSPMQPGQKRLEPPNRFPWPQSEHAVRQISPEQLSMLLRGIDFWNAHRRKNWQKVC